MDQSGYLYLYQNVSLMFRFLTLTKLRFTKGLYSPEYNQFFTRSKSNDYNSVFAFSPAMESTLAAHLRSIVNLDYSSAKSSINPMKLNRIDFGQSFDECLSKYGRPNLFSAAIEREVPYRVAGFKGTNGTVLYKTLLFFADKTFIMSEFHIYSGTDEQHMAFLSKILKSRSIDLKATDDDSQILIDSKNNILLVKKLAFRIIVVAFNRSNDALKETCEVLCHNPITEHPEDEIDDVVI